MAGVDHAYQYSVAVESRFSLFMDDTVNNEDPDILMSKLQNQRVERAKKEKVQVPPVVKIEKKLDKEPEANVKTEKTQSKSQSATKSPKPPVQTSDEHIDVTDHQEKNNGIAVQNAFRGRGGSRGFGRGYRGARGHAPRTHQGDFSQNGGDFGSQRDSYEPRGRFRPRAGYYRGRAANTDVRELPTQADNDHHDRQVNRGDESQSTWNNSPEEQEHSAVKSNAVAEVDETPVAVENQDTEKAEGKEEEPPTYTLEEYKAMRSHEKPAVTLASKGSRKPNDGEDVFVNMVAHRKIVEVIEDEYVKVEMDEEQPTKFEINVLYNDDLGSSGRQNRGFGNRGFIRGSRARGRPRMDRGGRGSFRGETRGPRGVPCVVYNDQEFPSLK